MSESFPEVAKRLQIAFWFLQDVVELCMPQWWGPQLSLESFESQPPGCSLQAS